MTSTATAPSYDVIVVGGGVMGCACALALTQRGRRVLVLERSVPGAEASSAAAGILGAQLEAEGPGSRTDLFLASRALYGAFAASLQEATGLDVGYRRCGAIHLGVTASALAWQQAAGLAVERLDETQLAALEPALCASSGWFYPDEAQVQPRVLFRALHIAAARSGVTFRTGTLVRRVAISHDRARGVVLEDGTQLFADHVLIAAGSWSGLVEGLPWAPGTIRPARGQVVELTLRVPPLRRLVFGDGAYLVTREDGRVLVGATLEFVGYHRDVTAGGVRQLLNAAIALCPALEAASFADSWSNFRPYSETGPWIGASEIPGLLLATGHHRNGILLAPLTAEMVAAAVEGRPYPIPPVTSALAPRQT